jgi:signal transduction histidine kinase
MKQKRRKNSCYTLKVIVPTILVGVLLMAIVFCVCTVGETKNGDHAAEKTLEFLKLQCLRYDNMIATNDTEDQIQLLDKTLELSRCLSEKDKVSDTAFLERYAREQRLSGIIVTDNKYKNIADICVDTSVFEDWADVLSDSEVREVIKYPKKRYISHIGFNDGCAYNYVALAMEDNNGIVLCYAHRASNVADDKQVRIENLLAGYRAEMDGIISITDGERVVSSNNTEFIGKKVTDYPLAFVNNTQIADDKITILHTDGTEYLARMSKCKSYYLYVFFPAKSVYSQRAGIMSYMLVVYIMVLLVLSIVKQLEANHTNRIKMDFLHQMSHDIRTPINGIRGMVRIGNSYPEDMAKQKECRDKIWDASGLLLDLVNDVLDMGKLESGEMKPEDCAFDLYELMENVTAIMENQAGRQNVTLKIDELTGSHWNLVGSAVYVRRILVNIISNAIKYNCQNGSVTISCRELKQEVDKNGTVYEFVCADTGIGMSAEFQKHMFEQFTQEKAVGEVAHHGTGLGLAIVKKLVDELKGTIRCESEIGKGTVFYITIPFIIDANVEQHKALPDDLQNKNLDGVTVLLVEDNDMNMEVAEFILTEEKATVIKAVNGQEAVDIFAKSKKGQIDIILMDIMMPIMDGETATRNIRSLNREDATTIPIIAMTANAFEEDIQSAIDAGMNAHIAKPVEPDKIKKAILHYLQTDNKNN